MVKRLKKALSPLEVFFQMETLSGLVLCFCAAGAMYWANSEYAFLYKKIVHFPFYLKLGTYSLGTTAHHIINEGFMTLFFFIVGLEIKREFSIGETSSPKKAAFPLIAGIGGMVIPAFIYYYINKGGAGEHAWGIPMATDIAFAIGILSFMSHKVPFPLKIFLLSLAIIDDIGAVFVMAFFYSKDISGQFLGLALLITFLIFLKFKLRIRSSVAFGFLGVALWVCFYHSGIHATLSGIVLGFLVPARSALSANQILDAVKKGLSKETLSLSKARELKLIVKEVHSPLYRLTHIFHPYVSFIILPLFAFFNAGVPLEAIEIKEMFSNPISQGIILGLVLGKPLGILLFSYLGVVFRISELPKGVNWKQITAVGLLAGIGFTMSLFIVNLSFDQTSLLSAQSKASVLVGSGLATVLGLFMLFFTPTVPKKDRKPEKER